VYDLVAEPLLRQRKMEILHLHRDGADLVQHSGDASERRDDYVSRRLDGTQRQRRQRIHPVDANRVLAGPCPDWHLLNFPLLQLPPVRPNPGG